MQRQVSGGFATYEHLRRLGFREYALAALLLVFAYRSLDMLALLRVQAPGADYSCFWAGVRALAQVERLYDFRYVSDLQGWPFGPDSPRPYIYPPSALFLFLPTAALPYWIGYGVWVAVTYALMAWSGRRMGAPWWMALFPVVWLVAICGQVTFLVAGLAGAALTLPRRPVAAGVLLGIAASLKPQLLVFAPLALIATRQWRMLFAAGATGAALGLASAAIWGLGAWRDWLAAMPRFQTEVILANPALRQDEITPFALLANNGLPGAWAFLLAPVAAGLVWVVFRRTDEARDRLIALFAAALLVAPYAMNYEACLFAPAVAAYLDRRHDRLWPLYATVACSFTAGLIYGPAPIFATLALPLSSAATVSRRTGGGRLPQAAVETKRRGRDQTQPRPRRHDRGQALHS